MAQVFNFIVNNNDLTMRFSCPNHKKRVREIVRNLRIDYSDEDSHNQMMCRFTSAQATFCFDDMPETENHDVRHEAVFFENTEYPLIVRGKEGRKIMEMSLSINGHLRSGDDERNTITSFGGELYGSLNFHNQVGLTEFCITYKTNEDSSVHELRFATEVLSYKLDYRTDLKAIISDIEHEYALLSASFLKDTYLSMRQHTGESNALVWWQIFRSCYQDIINATRQIIDRPKRRLKTQVRYERAERLTTLPRELENQWQLHKDNPSYLYRTEELVLSHDTTENRFLKYALSTMLYRYQSIKEHILTAMHLTNPMRIDVSLTEMEDELLRLHNHTFFRGVGVFHGFTQDSLVMKQALGYKTILERWVELQQAYELEEGLRRLEVKDISDLYEIWCFIKVKNIVADTLRELGKEVRPMVHGQNVVREFIPQLVYGGEVSFINQNGIELASVCYNAEVERQTPESAIQGTSTLTTVQRPDIVLRLSKNEIGGIKYTYLFDAKYRIDDSPSPEGYNVPPPDAIDQMHRYRDAIYYSEEGREHDQLKKEIIAGYVLFPGRIPPDALDLDKGNYYYQKSNRNIGIGAFPLRPDKGEEEIALRNQIRRWLESEGQDLLLYQSIPQKGLAYQDVYSTKGTFFLNSIDGKVNEDKKAIIEGISDTFYTGYGAILSGIQFKNIKYFAPVDNHYVSGFYDVISAEAVDMNTYGYSLEKPIRICLHLGKYTPIAKPFVYGIDMVAARGLAMTRKDFNERCKQAAINDTTSP